MNQILRLLPTLTFFIFYISTFTYSQEQYYTVQEKWSSVSIAEKESLQKILQDASSIVYIDEEDQPQKYSLEEGKNIQKVFIRSKSDFKQLKENFPKELKHAIIFEIEWDGREQLVDFKQMLAFMPFLQIIYVRSYNNISKEKLREEFPIHEQKKNRSQELLFYQMGEPQ